MPHQREGSLEDGILNLMRNIEWYLERERSDRIWEVRTWLEQLSGGIMGRTLEITLFSRVVLISWECVIGTRRTRTHEQEQDRND